MNYNHTSVIPIREWNRLKNAIQADKSSNEKKSILPPAPEFMYKKQNRQNKQSTTESLPALTDIQSLEDRTNSILRREKNLPIDLQRAMFLSNVFTEKANQLEFSRLLQKIQDDKENVENERIRQQQEENQRMKNESKINAMKKKLEQGELWKTELKKIKTCKFDNRKKEIHDEYVELCEIAKEEEKNKKDCDERELQRKKDLKKLFCDELQKKQEHQLRNPEEVKHENKCILNSSTPKKRRSFQKNLLEISSSHGNKRMAPQIISVPIPKKSNIEMKRELYEKVLKKERIQMYKHQMKERADEKDVTNFKKNEEYKQRLQNLDVTNALKKRKHIERLEKIIELRNIWNKQCAETKHKFEKERLEDKERLKKLQNDMRKEDEEFFYNVNAILHKFKKQEKIILPIMKCLQEFEETRISKQKQTCRQFYSQVNKTKD